MKINKNVRSDNRPTYPVLNEKKTVYKDNHLAANIGIISQTWSTHQIDMPTILYQLVKLTLGTSVCQFRP
jgi:hypothetical protein